VILFSLLIAPVVMAAAVLTERRLGPSAAGWVVALPVSFAVAVVAVTMDAGTETSRTMALSAATHVPAQVAFGIAFAAVLVRRGLALGTVAGTLAYVVSSIVVAGVPEELVVVSAIPVLGLAPRLMTDTRPRIGSRRRSSTMVLTCATASLIVGAAVITSRLAGPEAAGAVLAFPTMSALLAVTIAIRDGRHAGAHALTGLVRSLPCYLAFGVVLILAAPSIGVAGIALGVLACAAAARATWRAVPVAAQPAPAG
jgi:hypothetical protein